MSSKTIKGLIESAEYEYRQADGDADTYLENIRESVYMSMDGFPAEEYVQHLFTQGKISIVDVIAGLASSDQSDSTPYTQMIIRTKDNGALEHDG